MTKRALSLVAALALALSLIAPQAAYADESLGSVDEPNPAATSSGGESQVSTVAAADGVVVSAEGEAAVKDGASFAVEGFSRAQKGSNRDVEGVYSGYCYYVGSSADYAAVIATEGYVVAYAPESVAGVCDVSDESTQQVFKDYFISLDAASLNGGVVLSDGVPWHFTSESEIEIDGVVFRFGQELKEGSFYACVIGADGSDVVSDGVVSLTHADFAHVVEPASVSIQAPPTGLEAIVSWLASIDMSPLWVTLKTTGTAIVFIFVLGLAAAYFSLRIPKRAQDIADSIFTIPMVLPPTVCGFLLLLLLGKNTALGQWFMDIGCPLIFSWPATVIAAVVVAFPLMYRSARGAFENLDPNMLDAARTLGWSNVRIFFQLMLPLAWSSIAAGTVLSFARALGEFGATLFLAGNYLGVTRTIPIAIYFEWMNGNTDVALFWTGVIIVFSFIVILFINLWSTRTTKYRKGAVD